MSNQPNQYRYRYIKYTYRVIMTYQPATNMYNTARIKGSWWCWYHTLITDEAHLILVGSGTGTYRYLFRTCYRTGTSYRYHTAITDTGKAHLIPEPIYFRHAISSSCFRPTGTVTGTVYRYPVLSTGTPMPQTARAALQGHRHLPHLAVVGWAAG